MVLENLGFGDSSSFEEIMMHMYNMDTSLSESTVDVARNPNSHHHASIKTLTKLWLLGQRYLIRRNTEIQCCGTKGE